MCGRFAQYSSRDEYLEAVGISGDEITFAPTPVDRYNVAPGTKVLLLNQQGDELRLDPVYWGYKPAWWDKQALINARGETAATGRMFRPLWEHGRAVVPANGWYEWAREGSTKQPFYIFHKSNQPLFFAAIGKSPYSVDHGHEGFVIVTSASSRGMVDIHDRRPLVLHADAIREWLSPETLPERASELARDAALPEEAFRWHPVSSNVGNIRNQGRELIERTTPEAR